MRAKYINLFTDFGFKKIFAEEASKPLLIDFLNSLLPETRIVELTFKDKEKLGLTNDDRKAVYDIYCENDKGEKIIVELQKAKQNYFKDRTIYYSSFPIQEQAEKGGWSYQLKAVFCIGILDFKFDEDKSSKAEVIHTVQLKDQNNQVFYDKLKFVYLEMPNFNKSENELETRLDKWLYFIKHLENFASIPSVFEDAIFTEAFEKAEIANFSEQEQASYQASLKVFRDNKAVFEYATETAFNEGKLRGQIEGKVEGKVEGKIEGKIETAKQLKLLGVAIEIISKSTGLTTEEIEKL